MFLVAATDYRALIIKLADRLYLMKLLKDLPLAQRESLHYTLLAKITLAVYAPLADRLGIWQLKPELEDLSFRLLEPQKYIAIAKEFDQKKHERKLYITHIVIPALREKLEAFGVQAEISGRAKHIYSIYQKMEAKQLTFDKINDLLGVRIVVDRQEDCYTAQAILHAFWQPVTDVYDGKAGRDWIAHPKENEYQSLHTTIYFQDKEVEVQIRTHGMHEVAEYGADAAHWRYKARKAYRRGKTPKEARAKERIWSSQLAEKRRNVKLAEESVPAQQRDLLKKWIFVITPQGHVIDLDAGSTPLDFAYRIHTDLGHRYTGAKVGNHLVRLDYELQNGEIVELITSRVRKGPNPDWLAKSKDKDGKSNYLFARTRQARHKIHSWLNKHNNQDMNLGGDERRRQ
jgi:GTP pyrophosphokinase